MLHRLWIASLVTTLACSTGRGSAEAPIANRGAGDAVCAPRPPPFSLAPAVGPDDECSHGEAAPLLAAVDEPPTCHRFQTTGPTSAIESGQLDGRDFWIEQSGCVHATIRIVGTPAEPVARADRAQLVRAAGNLLLELEPLTIDAALHSLAVELVVAADRAPSGSFPIGAGDWTATVDADADGRLAITLDFPL